MSLVPLSECAEGSAGPFDGGTDGSDAGSSQIDAGRMDSGGADADSSPDGGRAEDWASGGTAAMTDKANYLDPFGDGLAACALVATTTEGPCTTADDQEREDISEAYSGLPVRLVLQVVDTQCQPLTNVTVEVWHSNTEGSYSGDTPNNNMCLQQQSYASEDFFRGIQSTDDDGEVYFDTCFPGWYRSRAVHLHFQVKDGANSYRISQLFFPESITQEVFASHPEYSSFGQPDTVFSNDNIMGRIPAGEQERHILKVSRMSDGAMLASKVVTVI